MSIRSGGILVKFYDKIKEINTEDEDMNAFLFRLGCYTGEPVTLISKKKKNCIVVIKDGRYNLDNLLAEAIIHLHSVDI